MIQLKCTYFFRGDSLFKAENITKQFEHFKLENINFTLKPGETLVIIGDNGSGKTSIINLIMGLIRPDSGRMELMGITELEDPITYKNNIGFIYDVFNFYPNLKLRDYKRIISMFYSNFDEDMYEMYFRGFKLNPEEKIKNLSKGQCEKIMITTALSHHAKLIIFDEPVYGMDKSVRDELVKIVRDYIKKENASVILSTHSMYDIDDIYDKVMYIEQGKVILNLSKEEVMREFRIVRTSRDKLEDMKENIVAVEHYNRYSEALIKIDGDETIRKILKNAECHKIKNPDIEDIIYYYKLGGENND